MLKIDDQYRNTLLDNNSKAILKGPTGCGKSTVLKEKFISLIEKDNIKSDNILVLLSNNTELNEWVDKFSKKSSGKVWVNTYYSFIQEELNTYYPLVLEKCSQIKSKRLKPVFLNFDAARYLVTKVVEWHRENKGIMPSISAQSDKIAAALIGNLNTASSSGIPFEEICYRLSQSIPDENAEKLREFKESENIIDAYRKNCISLGVFDYGIALEIYHKYLLNNDVYLEQLKKRVNHLLCDNIEYAPALQIDFINFLISDLRTCYLSYNFEKGRETGWDGSHKYIENRLFKDFEIIELNNSLLCSQTLQDFSDKLFQNLIDNNGKKLCCKEVQRVKTTELRSEMLEAIGKKICELVAEKGYKPSQIAVISTYADPVTETVISNITERQGILINNISRKKRVVDNSLVLGMVVMAQICNPTYKLYPNIDSIRVMVRVLFGLDSVRTFILAKEIYASNTFPQLDWLKVSKNWESLKGKLDERRYEYISKWVEVYRNGEEQLSIDKFIYKQMLEIFLSESISENDLKAAAYLYESAARFEKAVSRFENMNTGKGFLEIVLEGMKGGSRKNGEENGEISEAVVIATPQGYLSGPYTHKIMILTGVSSKNWMPRNVKELSNPIVLHKAWDKDIEYNEEMEEENQKQSVAYTISALTKRCSEKLLVYESLLSSNGYENDGYLADYI